MSNDKLQHEMYWNCSSVSAYICYKLDKLQHEMYWNAGISNVLKELSPINYNMRCIETSRLIPLSPALKDKLQHEMYWNNMHRPTLHIYTNDKLQHEMYWNEDFEFYNTLIQADKLQHEMYWNFSTRLRIWRSIRINYNMRCIETTYS